jgi:WxL domain surface cell wall-binding
VENQLAVDDKTVEQRRLVARVLSPVLLALVCALFATPARGAVALRASGCGSNAASTINVARPAGVQVGDLEIVTVTETGPSNDAIFEPAGSGWTWAGVGSANNGLLMASFWRRAAAGDPATWTFYSANGTGTSMAYGIEVYSGADPVNWPLAAADSASSASASATGTLPNSTSTYDGMMRHMAAGARGNVSQSISAGPTRTCNQQIAHASLLTAHESVNSGTTASRTITRTASTDAIMHSILIRPACSNGGLSATDPGTVSFGSNMLTGSDGFITTTFALAVDDQRASNAGWRLSASATPFTGPGGSLPATAATITSVSQAAGSGRCSAPVNAVAYPITLSGTGTAIYNSTGTNGQGPSTLSMGARLDYPANARIGAYTSTWTFSITSGP